MSVILFRILAIGIICKIYIWRTLEYLLSELVFWIAKNETFSRSVWRILDPLTNYSTVMFSENIPSEGTVRTSARQVFISDMDCLHEDCTYRFRLVVLMNHILYGYLRFSDVRRFLITTIHPDPSYIKDTYIYISTQVDFGASMRMCSGYIRINVGRVRKHTKVCLYDVANTEIFHDILFDEVNMSIQKPIETSVNLAELELLARG